ncbi:MAG TPA: hypothetical protein VK448_08280 [Dissulfurispiraceae bacterium]|nr:hypothetical protein [Dissulfurispiraceae bacterium]
MIFRPPIIALLCGSIIVSLMLVYSAYYGVMIVRRWDISSGSELQLSLERKTYLLSTIMSYIMAFQLASFFLFIFTVDDIHALFVGAMCAAGTLNVNRFGYPTVILKIVNFLMAGVWLIINYTDNRAFDYPLIKKKYLLLLAMTPLVILETITQTSYFLVMKANVITSCCGSLFSTETEGVTSSIAALPRIPMEISFFVCMGLTLASGIYFYLKQNRSGYIFSALSMATFALSVAALISFISLYFYELPTHHCPFCILQKEYNYIGYVLYLTLLGGAVSGMGIGALMPFRKITSLSTIVPVIQKKLVIISLALYMIYASISIYEMIFSTLRLEGY